VRGLMIRLARRINRLLFRRGRFWADRWHGHALKSPREVRNALVYVLKNRHKHRAHLDRVVDTELDLLSSAASFNGFERPIPSSSRGTGPPCVAPPRTWLLQIGWQRHGKIRSDETPKPIQRFSSQQFTHAAPNPARRNGSESALPSSVRFYQAAKDSPLRLSPSCPSPLAPRPLPLAPRPRRPRR
jgi:hypothetical protein